MAQVVSRHVLRRALASIGEDPEGGIGAYSRRLIHQASGVVLAQIDVSADDARLVIQGHAFAAGQIDDGRGAGHPRRAAALHPRRKPDRGGGMNDVAQRRLLETFATARRHARRRLRRRRSAADARRHLPRPARHDGSRHPARRCARRARARRLDERSGSARRDDAAERRAGPLHRELPVGTTPSRSPRSPKPAEEWRQFREAALAQGFRSMDALPLRLRDSDHRHAEPAARHARRRAGRRHPGGPGLRRRRDDRHPARAVHSRERGPEPAASGRAEQSHRDRAGQRRRLAHAGRVDRRGVHPHPRYARSHNMGLSVVAARVVDRSLRL